MIFKHFIKLLHFNKYQRTSLLILFILIIVLQLFYLLADFNISETVDSNKDKWLALQSEIDEKKLEKQNTAPVNFISDYKGYKLGMSVEEIVQKDC